jgi:hypothetical protein
MTEFGRKEATAEAAAESIDTPSSSEVDGEQHRILMFDVQSESPHSDTAVATWLRTAAIELLQCIRSCTALGRMRVALTR